MARTKQSARPGLGGREKEVMTWTRFHLPVDQEWPTWRDAKHADDVHRGPLAGLEGVLQAWLGRMVDDPEQAVYIVRWKTQEDLESFQSSPSCTEFLQSLPEHPNLNPPGSTKSLPQSSSSSSRFLTLQRFKLDATNEFQGRAIFTAFSVPSCSSNELEEDMNQDNNDRDDLTNNRKWAYECYEKLKRALGLHVPRGPQPRPYHPHFWWQNWTLWCRVLEEDSWVQEKFGVGGGGGDRTILCEFRLRPAEDDQEEHSATGSDAKVREAWSKAMTEVTPDPVTAWYQERWDFWEMPWPMTYSDDDDAEDVEEEDGDLDVDMGSG